MIWKWLVPSSLLVISYLICFVVLYIRIDESQPPSLESGSKILVNGSGATFPAPQYFSWIANFDSRLKARFTYDAVGSGQGKTEFFAGQNLWGGSDSDVSASTLAYFLPDSSGYTPSNFNLSQYVNPLAPEHLGTLMIPSLTGGLAIVHNTPDIKGQLVLTGDILGRIFCGNITWWNDTALTALNPNIVFPKDMIYVAARDDSSGTTQLFTTYLSNSSPTFKTAIGVSSQPKWPSSFVKRDSSIALAYVVETLKNSISYAPTDALVGDKKRFAVAALINKDGVPVLPVRENIVSAMTSLDTSMTQKRNYFSILNQPGASSYPLATFTYILLREHYFYFNSSGNCDRVKAMVEFWRFAWDTQVGQQLAAAAGWIPLSGGALALSLRTLGMITCNKVPVTDWFDTESRKDQFFGEHLRWYTSVSFWDRVKDGFKMSKYSSSIYVTYFFLVLIITAILFYLRFTNLNTKEERSEDDEDGDDLNKEKLKEDAGPGEDPNATKKIRLNLDNLLTLLGVAIGFQQYLSQMILKSKVTSGEPFIFAVIEYTGLLFFSSLGYLIALNVFALLFNIGMIYILFVFPYLLEHYPLKVARLSSLHSILQIFLPNFAIIFYTPAVEMLSSTLVCKYDPAAGNFYSTLGYSCWNGYHWILVGFSIILSACFVCLVIFYSHVFKTLRKYCDLKDATWLPVVESFVKLLIIFAYINLPNAYFLAILFIVMGCISFSIMYSRPSEHFWYDLSRTISHFILCILSLALLILEVTTDENDYRRRQEVSNAMVIAIPTIAFAFIGLFFVFSETRFERMTASAKDREDFEKFVMAFSEEVQMSMEEIPHDSASRFESMPYLDGGALAKRPVSVEDGEGEGKEAGSKDGPSAVGGAPLAEGQASETSLTGAGGEGTISRRGTGVNKRPLETLGEEESGSIPGLPNAIRGGASNHSISPHYNRQHHQYHHHHHSKGPVSIRSKSSIDFPWEHLAQLARKAKLARIISEAQSDGLQLAAKHKDEVVATLFRSANGNFKEFIGIMSCTQWQLMAMRRAAAANAGKGGSKRSSKVDGTSSAGGSRVGSMMSMGKLPGRSRQAL
ncbi:Phosphate-binding protein PstS 1 [Phlyctochytrium planicorne]|nr:Phosphate-binding protein PstS 1 [Phlyctochytrium planicorne]